MTEPGPHRPAPAAWVIRPFDSVSIEPGAGADTSIEQGDDITVLFDGVLYDESSGIEVASMPAKAVQERYRAQGAGCFGQLRGHYALVVVDHRSKIAYAVRDHLGSWPLFWADAPSGVHVSVSPVALAAPTIAGAELNRPALVEWAMFKWLDTTETLYRNVSRVPPGHYVRITPSSTELVEYWSPLARTADDWVKADEVERFDELFIRAVERCVAAGDSAILLSGGLDSCSVAGIAAKVTSRTGAPPPIALSIAFPDPTCNEEEVQRAAATKLGLEQVMLGFHEAAGGQSPLRATLEWSARAPQPMLSLWLPVYDRIMREGAGRDRSVVLTGTGGDEWLGVTPYYGANLIQRGDIRGLFRLWRNFLRSSNSPRRKVTVNTFWRFGARDLVLGVASRIANRIVPGPLGRRRRRLLETSFQPWVAPDPALRAEVCDRMILHRDDHSERDLYRRELMLGVMHPLVSLEAEENYERGRAAGLAMRHPFLDPDLVTFLARTPPELLNRGGRSKGLIRDAVARQLPGLGFDRQKKVSATKFSTDVLFDHLPSLWSELDGLSALRSLGVVDGRLVQSEATRIFEQRDTAEIHRLWYLLALETWVRGHSASGGWTP